MRKLIYLSIVLLLCSIGQSEAKTWRELFDDIPKASAVETQSFFKQYEKDSQTFFKDYNGNINAKTLGKKTPLRFFSSHPNIFKHLAPILLTHKDIDVNFVYKNESALTNTLYEIGRNIHINDEALVFIKILEMLIEKQANLSQKNSNDLAGFDIILDAMKDINKTAFNEKNTYENLESCLKFIPFTQENYNEILKIINTEGYTQVKKTEKFKSFTAKFEKKLEQNNPPKPKKPFLNLVENQEKWNTFLDENDYDEPDKSNNWLLDKINDITQKLYNQYETPHEISEEASFNGLSTLMIAVRHKDPLLVKILLQDEEVKNNINLKADTNQDHTALLSAVNEILTLSQYKPKKVVALLKIIDILLNNKASLTVSSSLLNKNCIELFNEKITGSFSKPHLTGILSMANMLASKTNDLKIKQQTQVDILKKVISADWLNDNKKLLQSLFNNKLILQSSIESGNKNNTIKINLSTTNWEQFKSHFADRKTNTIDKLNEILNITPTITKDNFSKNLENISKEFFKVFTEDLNNQSPHLESMPPLEYIFKKWDRPKLVEIFLKNDKVKLDFGSGSTSGVTNQACLKLGYNYQNENKVIEWMQVMLKTKPITNWNSTTSPESIIVGIQKYHETKSGKWDKRACYLFARIKALKLDIDKQWIEMLKTNLDQNDVADDAACKSLLQKVTDDSTTTSGVMGALTKSLQNLKKKLQSLNTKLVGFVKTN